MMKHPKIVIVGGVAGGMSAATRLRRLLEEAEIIVLEKGPYVSFANCGLPYYLSGEIANREQLLVQTKEKLNQRFKLDVRVNHEVVAIDRKQKLLQVLHQGKTESLAYDYLILSTGAKAYMPDLPGIDQAKQLFSVRNIPDIDAIMNSLQTGQVKEVTVIGSGFVGLEMVENLAKRDLKVTLIEQAKQVLPALDEEMAVFIEEALQQNKVNVKTNVAVSAFLEEGRILQLSDGSQLTSDLTILAIGVQPATQLAQQAGLTLGLRSGIVVDEHFRTSDPTIFAIGDAIVVNQQISQQPALISLASPANRQGRQVADVIAGLKRTHRGSLGTAIVRVFEQVAAFTGLTEKAVKALNLPYQVVHTLGKSHASYYPGAEDILLKLIFHPQTGKIYGAQAIGKSGVDKRMDVLATAIKAQLTVFDLPELELSYAPPFGSAKDPVNMLGYAAMNLIEGFSETIQWHELAEQLAQGKILLDVRTKEEYEIAHIKTAYSIPLDELRDRLSELNPAKSYIVSCHSGLRSYLAERILKQNGFKVQNLDGAFYLYSHAMKGRNIDVQ